MRYEWDTDKARANLEKHGVSFEDVARFDWDSAIEAEDIRYDYGELRMQALGLIDNRLHVLVYTMRGNSVRVISLRKANRRDIR